MRGAGVGAVADYRAYVLAKSGNILKRHDFDALNDAAALEHARQYVDEQDIEVWQLGRVVGLLKPKE